MVFGSIKGWTASGLCIFILFFLTCRGNGLGCMLFEYSLAYRSTNTAFVRLIKEYERRYRFAEWMIGWVASIWWQPTIQEAHRSWVMLNENAWHLRLYCADCSRRRMTFSANDWMPLYYIHTLYGHILFEHIIPRVGGAPPNRVKTMAFITISCRFTLHKINHFSCLAGRVLPVTCWARRWNQYSASVQIIKP